MKDPDIPIAIPPLPERAWKPTWILKEFDLDLTIEENTPLALYTTFGIGGPARFLVRARTEEQVINSLEFARKNGCPVFILGRGSNLVVSDSGFPGLVLKMEISGITLIDEESGISISAGAGEEWDSLVQNCVGRNLAGIECLSGIPGTVGGTPVQNVGAYGQEVSEVIIRVRVVDRSTCSLIDLGNDDCRFSYRSSIFNTAERERYIVLRVDYSLKLNGEASIRYHDLRRFFDHCNHTPSIHEVREAVLKIRKVKGMVLSDQDPDSRGAGSFFKNPIASPDQTAAAEERAWALGVLAPSERIPRFHAPSGQEKLPAAWFVERAGFRKGFTSGRTGISSKHCLAIINRGGASAQDVVDLMHTIQDRVRTQFGIELHPEPVFLGFGSLNL
jgi:UDP-N-acetylmuramate dehydrogenase